MGLIDAMLDFGPVGGGRLLRRNLKAGERLLAEGTPGRARIDGIKVRDGTDDDLPTYEWALLLADGRRLGCRQNLPDGAGLGREVDVRFDDKRVIVVLGDGDAYGWKGVDPPERGVDDDRHRKFKGSQAAVEVLGIEPVVVFGMVADNVNIRVRIDGASEGMVKRAIVPTYAAHLCTPGAVLPAWIRDGRPDKVRIDWPAAAVADANRALQV